MGKLKRLLLLAAGTLSVALGVLGMFLPVLPTTPFLLLAAYCFARSSNRAHQWLLDNRWFGKHLRSYREGRGIALREKVLTLLVLWLSIGYAAGWMVVAWWVRLALVGVAAGVTIHLVRTKTLRPHPEHPEPAGEPGSGQENHTADLP
ncbi:MAG: YbaN family protein [Gemmatimonadota bacterium]